MRVHYRNVLLLVCLDPFTGPQPLCLAIRNLAKRVYRRSYHRPSDGVYGHGLRCLHSFS